MCYVYNFKSRRKEKQKEPFLKIFLKTNAIKHEFQLPFAK